ncbi:cysteine desulfurase IscS-like [Eurosta solidaginis]|uniref:cysteine desulfurase IscS-like n=1 Tax=Eurosta solidaginis TaxID=178769 RepID=UPI003530E824
MNLCRSRNIFFHTDAAHAVGKIAINTINIDLMSIFGHKLYGPKVIWALYIQSGSGQERGIRSGNVPVLIWCCIPKYIGFTKPPTGTGAAYNGSESDGELQKRSTRRRELLIYTTSPDIGGSDSELLTDATTTRRTRNQAVSPSPTTLAVASKKFISPIEKLLVRNCDTKVVRKWIKSHWTFCYKRYTSGHRDYLQLSLG